MLGANRETERERLKITRPYFPYLMRRLNRLRLR